MKKIIVALLILVFTSCSGAAEAPKVDKPGEAVKAPMSETKTASVSPDVTAPPKKATVQDLQAQRTMMLLRIDGAETCKSAIEKLIVDGRVAVDRIDQEIEKMKPEKK